MALPLNLEDLLVRVRAGESIDFDALEHAHPDQRGVIARLRDLAKALGSQGPPESFAERLRQKYGEGVDPGVSLGGSEGGDAGQKDGPSSEFLNRLRDRSGKRSRYKLEGEVARGGMGAILRVWDEDLRRQLAMKVILGRSEKGSESTTGVDPRILARFLEEAQVTGQLDHPGIVPVHELGIDDEGQVYFTMKLVKGRNLKAVFDLVFQAQEGWNKTRALSVLLRACEALAYAHAKGVIHRDLKPANVMVGNFGEVYVMDWGLARVVGCNDRHDIRIKPEGSSQLSSVKTERRAMREEGIDSPLITMDGQVMGTPAYMSPEQARGEIEKLGPRSDVYSVGAMLYHLLAQQVPYVPNGVRMSNYTVLGLVIQGPPKPLSALQPNVAAELVAITEKAMARDAGIRYADTHALAHDLRAYLEHRVVGAYETGAWAEAKMWVRRNKALASALACAVLSVVVGLWASVMFARSATASASEAHASAASLDVANKSLLRVSRGLIGRVAKESFGKETEEGTLGIGPLDWQALGTNCEVDIDGDGHVEVGPDRRRAPKALMCQGHFSDDRV